MLRTATTTLALAGLLMLPTGLAAQERQTGGQEKQQDRMRQMMGAHHGAGMMGVPGMMGPMMQVMMATPTPGHILMQRELLGLTEEQTQRLEAIQEELRTAHERHVEDIATIHDGLRDATNAEDGIDTSAFESALRELADHHVELAVEVARSSRDALHVLTEDQRSRVQYGMRLMRHMMSQGMMMRGPMMRDAEEDGSPMMRGRMHHQRSDDGR